MTKDMDDEGKKHGEYAASCALQHRRSKSVSDRNSDLSKQETFQSMEAEFCESQSQSSLHTMRSNATGGSLTQDSGNNTTNASPSHRVSLENDIKKLQLDLHREKSTRYMLEKAIGRVSSTLSPGHKNFSTQTRELIEEIEMLEEEIANREQHVLSLYRSIFDECMSLPSSSQSSVVTSPAHAKVRKHPSVISSAFCSSKKFPLQHFQVLTSIKESVKGGSGSCVGPVKSKIRGEFSDSAKLSNCGSNSGRSSIGCTLKEHLYQCPNKISEELVKCLAALYCKASPTNNSNEQGPLNAQSAVLSRSATSVTFPRRSKGEQFCLFSNGASVEVPAGEYQPLSAPHALSNYRMLVEQLEGVDFSSLQDSAKTAFWINVYNSLIMHAYLVCGTSQSPLRRMAVFHKAAYNIGGHMVTADSIENSFLGFRTPRIGRWFENILSNTMRKRYKDEHILESKLCLHNSKPIVFFALCTGASSDPMMRMYTAKNVASELEKARIEFLQASIVVKNQRKVLLPRILERYAKEASLSNLDLLQFASENVETELGEAIKKCVELNKRKKTSQIIEWLPYNTRFMYIFSKDLIEKP